MHSNRRWLRASLFAVTMVAGLGSIPLSAGASVRSTSQIPHGGTLTMTMSGLFVDIDPGFGLVSSFTAAVPMSVVFGPGLLYANATTGQIEDGFAQSITSSSGGKVWTMTLHPKMKFSDGTPFNAASVCDDIARLANPATGSALMAQAQETPCKAVNATVVRFTLKSPNFYFPNVVSQDFPFIPSPTAIASEGAQFPTNPIGPGPFRLQSQVTGVTQTFVANPYYKYFAPGQPYLSSLVLEASGTLSQEVAALQSGQAQISDPFDSQYATEMRAAGMTAPLHGSDTGAFLALNAGVPPFNNVLARQAVWDVINRAGVSNVWAPGNPVTTNLFPTSSPYYNKALNWPAGGTPATIAKAQTIFNQLAAAGTPVNFTIVWPASVAASAPAYIQSEFAGMQNVTVNIRLDTQIQFTNDAADGNFQMLSETLYNSTPVPGLQQWFQTGGPLNYMHWSDPKADTALTALYSDKTLAQQKSDWNAFIAQLIAEDPVIWIQQGRIGLAYNAKVLGGVHQVEYGNIGIWGQIYMK